MKHLKHVGLLTACLLLGGCYAAGEKIRSVNFEGNVEKKQLAPHEERLEQMEYLARPH